MLPMDLFYEYFNNIILYLRIAKVFSITNTIAVDITLANTRYFKRNTVSQALDSLEATNIYMAGLCESLEMTTKCP